MIFMGAADGEIGRLLLEADCGEVVPSGDSDALISSILGMMNARDRGEAMGQRERALFEQRFSKTAAMDAWERVLVEAGKRSAE
jgi:glycosyltransferase involved in cell wall biosynthesis